MHTMLNMVLHIDVGGFKGPDWKLPARDDPGDPISYSFDPYPIRQWNEGKHTFTSM